MPASIAIHRPPFTDSYGVDSAAASESSARSRSPENEAPSNPNAWPGPS